MGGQTTRIQKERLRHSVRLNLRGGYVHQPGRLKGYLGDLKAGIPMWEEN